MRVFTRYAPSLTDGHKHAPSSAIKSPPSFSPLVVPFAPHLVILLRPRLTILAEVVLKSLIQPLLYSFLKLQLPELPAQFFSTPRLSHLPLRVQSIRIDTVGVILIIIAPGLVCFSPFLASMMLASSIGLRICSF